MKNTTKLLIGLFCMVAFVSCEKKSPTILDTSQPVENGNLKKMNPQNVIGLVNSHKNELKDDMDLFAKAVTALAEDQFFKQAVVQGCLVNKSSLSVTFADLEDFYTRNQRNLRTELNRSLDMAGASQSDKARVAAILRGRKVGQFDFLPRIVFPALKKSKFIRNGWDGLTPCGVAISLFYMPARKIPVYTIDNRTNSIVQNKVVHLEQEKRPTWHISFKHNINFLDETGRPIDAIQGIFQQEVDCRCCNTCDDPPVPFCEFDHPSPIGECPDTRGPSGNCDGSCDPAVAPVVITLEQCSIRK